MGHIFVLADFLFVDGEDIAILAACGAGESHGFELLAIDREQEFRSGSGMA